MLKAILRIYDYCCSHRRMLWVVLAVFLIPLIVLAATLHYNEDIMDFLPITTEEKETLHNMQAQQSAAQIVLIVEGEDEVQRLDAIDAIDEKLYEANISLSTDLSERIDMLYANMPALISDSTYSQFDSLFTPQAIHTALQRDLLILSTPGTSALAPAIQHDPLGLVHLSNLQSPNSEHKSFAFVQSPYGSTETKHNAALVDSLNTITSEIASQYPDLQIRWISPPRIAVGTARRIKTDTFLCIALSLVLIVILLLYAFPRHRDILLILLAVSFGWLVGMAALHLATASVSAVVLGIGSVLIGIAVNYPLHLLVHQRYTTSVRQTLDEVLSPLVVGNITTVGAFLALIPLQATALRQLGIFAAAMLIGTIFFCIFVLPHLMSAEPTPIRELKLPITNHKWAIPNIAPWLILALTVLCGGYLLIDRQLTNRQLFDSNLTHINYMTDAQRADMASFDISLNTAAADRWTAYWQTHDADAVIATVQTDAAEAGFRPEAFEPFYETLRYPLSSTHSFSFNDIAQRLSEDFDYIGLVCSAIVFFFLWLSFRNLWLALIAFVPMALSWVWIIAIMQLIGLHFNIVNIILATFIFGQGDDYTIFIVEGLVYEHRTGKPILPQYRQSIVLSALIMLIGIGILVLAQHPAMHSLGAVILIGMAIVLLMANTIPPILFRLYTKCGGKIK